MEVITKLEQISMKKDTAIAVGTFDGVHAGHQRIISAALEREDLSPAVFTFSGNPSGDPQILTLSDKLAIMEQLGMAYVFCLDFIPLRDMPAERYVLDILLKRCRSKRICCGPDFTFGRGAKGGTRQLRQLCEENRVEFKELPFFEMNGEKVSSSRIRACLEAGDVRTANLYLGRPFSYSLEVIHGNHIGTGLGTPTINQALPEELILPKFGVYASFVKIDETYYYGVTNIGVKPTVGSDRVLSETWIPEFSGDLYGKEIRIDILAFIRAERKFSSLDAMKEEILKNAETAKGIASGMKSRLV